MKILVLTSVYKDYEIGSKDTSTNIVNSFVYDWERQGHEVIVIHNSHRYPRIVHSIPNQIKNYLAKKMGFTISDYEAVKYKKYIDKNVLVYRIPLKKYIPHHSPSKSSINKQEREIIKILESRNFYPDVITGHWASPQLELISKLKLKYKCKTACVLHGIGYINDSKFNASKYLPNIDKLGCRSKSQAERIKKILKLDYLPFVCYSGVPDNYLKNYTLSTEKFKNIKTLNISYVGRLLKYKNVDKIIMALSSLNNVDWKLNIVGEGAERIRLEALSEELNCSEKIIFWGRVSREKVMEILSDTHIFIMISTNEIFGLVYLEAMAASCLTIASKKGGVDGIIVNGINGYLCEEGNEVELENVLKNLIISQDCNKLIRIVEKAYLTASNYSDSKMADLYLNNIK